MNKRPNVAVGLLRPPRIFFYEIDTKDKNELHDFHRDAWSMLDRFCIYETEHGYHLIGFPYSIHVWKFFKNYHPSDFTKKLKPRFGRKNPQILRISEKFDSRTGRVVSPAPKRIIGDFELKNIEKYKVWYYAK